MKTPKTSIVKTETNSPASLLKIAIESKADIQQLEKLMDLQERWNTQQAKKKFLIAISSFQKDCPIMKKTKKVSFGQTRYSYTPLGEIASMIKRVMNKNGLSYRWEMKDGAEKLICTCIISHIDGHNEQTTMSANKDASGSKNEIQQRGSTITYLQRYTLISALGISTADEDVDGKGTKTPEKEVHSQFLIELNELIERNFLYTFAPQ